MTIVVPSLCPVGYLVSRAWSNEMRLMVEALQTDARLPASLAILVPMVKIPAGWFLMGSDKRRDPFAYASEQPQRRVYLSTYEIDRYETSNILYQQFVQATDHAPPSHWHGRTVAAVIADDPVIDVNWYDAQAFCQWAGKRLPTEAEWGKAARGTEGALFPWGDMPFKPGLANFGRPLLGRSHPPLARVDDYEQGRSPYGVYNMSGNVSEWVADWWSAESYRTSEDHDPTGPPAAKDKVVRGGSWADDGMYLRAAVRTGVHPLLRDQQIGFRCVRDVTDRVP